MTQALAQVQYRPGELTMERLGDVMVKSGFFQDTKDQAQAIVKMLAGQELGIGPIAAMTGIYIVKGKVTLSANLVGAAIQRSGKYHYWIVKLTDDECVLRFLALGVRDGKRPSFDSSFTVADAKKAGIATDMYTKFPRNMLFSRALTNGARWFCPEVFNGPVYTPDELGADVDDDGRVVEVNGSAEPYVPTREHDPEESVNQYETEEALASWIAVCGEADRLKISHKEIPAGSDVAKIERWTVALMDKINAATPRPAEAAF